MIAKRPAFQYYPGDWQRDTALRSCSIEARGLWIEMINLMHDGEPYGHLTAGGIPVTAQMLATLVGLTASKTKRLITELEEKKIFSRTDEGTIYSRRMVRDENLRLARANGGKLGGNPNLVAKDGDKDSPEVGGEVGGKVEGKVNHPANLVPTPAFASADASASASANHSSSPVSAASATKLCAAANLGLAKHPTHPQPIPKILVGQGSTVAALEQLAKAGVPEDFAEAAIYDIATSHSSTKGVGGLRFFANTVVQRWEQKLAADDAARSTVGARAGIRTGEKTESWEERFLRGEGV